LVMLSLLVAFGRSGMPGASGMAVLSSNGTRCSFTSPGLPHLPSGPPCGYAVGTTLRRVVGHLLSLWFATLERMEMVRGFGLQVPVLVTPLTTALTPREPELGPDELKLLRVFRRHGRDGRAIPTESLAVHAKFGNDHERLSAALANLAAKVWPPRRVTIRSLRFVRWLFG
jgi:hypothetical protein